MSKFEYLNLTQKMIKIRKMVPKLIRKRTAKKYLMILCGWMIFMNTLPRRLRNMAWILRYLPKSPPRWILPETRYI